MADTGTGRHFPEPPPMLDGEDGDAYTNRLTGADRTGRVPYDHVRNRQCSIGWHDECSDRDIADAGARRCQCPCHDPGGRHELRAWRLEESVVIGYALASGNLASRCAVRPGWADRLKAGLAEEAEEICERRPRLTAYLADVRKHHAQHVSPNFPEPGICVSRCGWPGGWPCHSWQLADAVDAALARHQVEPGMFPPQCGTCHYWDEDLEVFVAEIWPCPTYQAITGALLGDTSG